MVFKFLSKPNAKMEIVSQNKVLPGTLLPVEIRLTARKTSKRVKCALSWLAKRHITSKRLIVILKGILQPKLYGKLIPLPE